MLKLLKVKTVDDKVITDKDEFEQFTGDLSSELETLEILSDKKLMDGIKRSKKDLQEGKICELKNEKDIKS